MRALALGLIVAASPLAAEELPDLGDVLGALNGVEVQASGYIASRFSANPTPFFKSDAGYFEASFALDRETVRALERCDMSGFPGGCPADISAEIQFKDGEPHLLIYDVRNLELPE